MKTPIFIVFSMCCWNLCFLAKCFNAAYIPGFWARCFQTPFIKMFKVFLWHAYFYSVWGFDPYWLDKQAFALIFCISCLYTSIWGRFLIQPNPVPNFGWIRNPILNRVPNPTKHPVYGDALVKWVAWGHFWQNFPYFIAFFAKLKFNIFFWVFNFLREFNFFIRFFLFSLFLPSSPAKSLKFALKMTHLERALAYMATYTYIYIHTYTYTYTYIYAVESKLGPRFGVSWVKTWSKVASKLGPRFFFACFSPNLKWFLGILKNTNSV